MNLSSIRVGGIAALGFAVLVMVVNLLLGTAGLPQPGATPEEVREFFATTDARVTVSTALAPIAWILLPVFAAGVAAAARRRSVVQGDAWPLVGLGAAIMQNCLFGGVVATQAVLSAGSLSADVEWGVWQLHTAFFSLNAVSLAIIMASLSLAGVRTGLIRRWHATLGCVSAGAMTVVSVTTPLHMDGGPLGLLGLAGFLAWVVWLATYGVVLLRAAKGTAEVAAATEPVAVNA
ncbi:hypothetical protein IEZ26_09045 [Nocardioides cavernae]|uniref:DUF4386 family protein n=1 Tax=Nocardioides cavernae TaxID=1921566 RepID=A0ABR8N9D9_9ACTN|nr:hypothetical protein [Nocardioides cavernae]MBD3924761.1 hypothetical protein [Nocardioides cavernae]MBM7514865.1 hypothetical protein [Nocardioides cavernae]